MPQYELDLDLAWERYWHPIDEDLDRMRKKQAEFLVKYSVPPNCTSNIVVYNQERQVQMQQIKEEFNINLNIHINPKGRYYY